MLSDQEYGWTDFQLPGTNVYSLSYLDDIAFEWLEQAIHGLETMRPFCVKGFMEPRRFLCLVSYWNCHIICENENRGVLDKDDIAFDYSNTSMLEFCENLYIDIRRDIDGWVEFASYNEDDDLEKKKALLEERLSKLSDLIAVKQEHFSQGRCFL